MSTLSAAPVNKHYLEKVMHVAETMAVEVIVDILDVRGMMLNYIKLALDKGLEGRNYKFDLNTPEAVRIGSFHPAVPAAVAQEVEALVAEMKAGKLKPQPL